MKKYDFIEVDNKEIKLGNLDKILWSEEGYTKKDLVEYYIKIAPYILPHLIDRPIMLNRYPEGIMGEHFYQKNISGELPDWIQRFKHKNTEYFLCQDAASLILLAQLGCIEINPWMSRVQNIDHPDFAVLDLDPVDISFVAVIETAVTIHEFLEKLNIYNFCKTTGGRGMHVYIPLEPKFTHTEARLFCQIVAEKIHQELPDTTSLERLPKNRKGRVYLDCFQNGLSKTVVAPYSVKPVPGAQVSAPLLWKEVNVNLNPKRFNIKTMPKRARERGDLFSKIYTQKNDLKRCLEKLTKKP